MQNFIFGLIAVLLIIYWVIAQSTIVLRGAPLLIAIVLAFLAGYFTKYPRE